MVRNRCVLVLTLASFLAILFPVMGWCGPPVGPADRGAPPDQSQQMPPGPTPGAEPGAQGGFYASGSLGNTGVDGANGASPQIQLSDLGLDSALGKSGRAKYVFSDLPIGVTIIGDYSWVNLTGSTSSYAGNVGNLDSNQPRNGAAVDSTFNVAMASLLADFDLTPILPNFGLPIRMGPRIGWVQYISQFDWEETDQVSPRETHASKSYGMGSVGFWGLIDLARLVGLGTLTLDYGTVSPMLNFAATIGQGGNMRYYEWELMLDVYQSPNLYSGDYFTVPPISAQIGLAKYYFNETTDRLSAGSFAPANANHSLNVWIARVSAAL